MKLKTTLCVLAAALAVSAGAASLEQGFQKVPNAAKPWVYWWWLKGNVDEASITSDLEAMKQNGIGGLLMFDARGYHEDHVIPPPSKMEFMSPEWRRMLKFAIEKAANLGLQVSVNLSSCAGALKGPWEVGDDAPKKLVWNFAEVRGPQKFVCNLQKPAGARFWEVGLMAVRVDEQTALTNRPSATLADNWEDVQAKLRLQTPVAEAISLSDKVDAHGKLAWDVPAGRWLVLRFACVTIEGHEYDVDILDPKAVTGHFERMGRPILRDAGALAGKTLTHFYSVSWEGAVPTWTLDFEQYFSKYRGYNVRAWLPCLAGFALKSREESERFLRDFHTTLADCFMDNFYGTLHQLCGGAGLQWHSESGGPWSRKLTVFDEADQLAFLARNDMPQTEFWWPRRSLNRPAAMTAHIYGKPLAAIEAFTHMQQHWSAYPATLKPRADAAFCDGLNHFIWHTFTASPPELGKPGSEYFAGTHINPRITWWPQAGGFLTYLGRNQFMLRQGKFVADVCAYIGDKPYLHWDETNWSAHASLKLGPGYTYDLVNNEVLLTRMTVKDGDLVLPDGMRYRVLAVDPDDEVMSPAVLARIGEFVKGGATVVFGQRRPQRAPGLADYPACDKEVGRLASELWTQTGPRTVADALNGRRVLPDFAGPWPYTHRRTAEGDIYFVAGKGASDCVFRVSGKEPELWDPVTGSIRPAVNWRATDDGRTLVPIELPENGSTFVVFHKSAKKEHKLSVPAWQNGSLALSGPWQVAFEPGRGAPSSAVFNELTPWDKHADEGIKYFSGAATYRQSFDLTKEQARQLVRLSLGQVKYIAQVKVNGKEAGIVWTDPWSVELTGKVKSGRNELEIIVANTWVNRLIGDASLPKEKRIAQTNVGLEPGKRTLKIYQSFAPSDPLMPSGLLGPVRLEFGAMNEVKF